MKKIFYLILVCFFSLAASGQTSYSDSILQYQEGYKKDLYSIIKNDTAFVRFFPIDSSYRVMATVEKLQGQFFFPMPTSGEKIHQAIRYALIKFNLHGKKYELFAYQLAFLMNNDKHKEDFFIPFTDSTSGIDSYGGGKYIDFIIGDIIPDNKLLIDFNKSYNPYCAFRSGYNCPIPPKENDLSAEIKAGEMNFGKSKH